MPAPNDNFRPFISPAARARMVTACMARFNALDVQDWARYGKVTPPLGQFLKLMREQSGQGFGIRRNGDDLIILDEDGQPASTFPTALGRRTSPLQPELPSDAATGHELARSFAPTSTSCSTRTTCSTPGSPVLSSST